MYSSRSAFAYRAMGAYQHTRLINQWLLVGKLSMQQERAVSRKGRRVVVCVAACRRVLPLHVPEYRPLRSTCEDWTCPPAAVTLLACIFSLASLYSIPLPWPSLSDLQSPLRCKLPVLLWDQKGPDLSSRCIFVHVHP